MEAQAEVVRVSWQQSLVVNPADSRSQIVRYSQRLLPHVYGLLGSPEQSLVPAGHSGGGDVHCDAV